MPCQRAFHHVTPPRGASKDFLPFGNFPCRAVPNTVLRRRSRCTRLFRAKIPSRRLRLGTTCPPRPQNGRRSWRLSTVFGFLGRPPMKASFSHRSISRRFRTKACTPAPTFWKLSFIAFITNLYVSLCVRRYCEVNR